MPKFTGQETIAATPERIWDFLMDPQRFTACAPAMQNVRIRNEREFTFDVAVMGRRIPFKAIWERREPPSYARQTLEGGSMLTGGAKMDNEFHITPDGPISTITWSADVELSGAAKMLVSEQQLRGMVDSFIHDAIVCIKRQLEG